MNRLAGKVAVITGAASGMGQATALVFAREGAKVIVADLIVDNGIKTVEAIKESGGEAIFVKTDVTRSEDVKHMVETAVETYGKLDILDNNAGITERGFVPISQIREEDWDKVLGTNLKGVFLGMKFAIPEMIKAGGGSIINISSIAADAAMHNTYAYSAAKGGVISISRVAALENAIHNIRVNVIKPGVIETPMASFILESKKVLERIKRETPQGRLGRPEEVAYTALFFASDESSHITGQKIAVDGGIEADCHIL
ncbi:SDR family NAD(P)-dependent oxidoreductase [Chloroflexota bacterium]